VRDLAQHGSDIVGHHRRRMVRTDVADTRMSSLRHSPTMRR
jgi:hypothetical protein